MVQSANRLPSPRPMFAWVFLLTIVATPPPGALGASGPSYVAALPDAVWFVQWSDTKGFLTGRVQRAFVTADNPFVVRSEIIQVAGRRSRGHIKFTLGESTRKGTPTWKGTLKSGTLELVIPSSSGPPTKIVLHAGTVEDYDRAVMLLRQRLAQAAAQAEEDKKRLGLLAVQRKAVADADDAVRSAGGTLIDLTNALGRHIRNPYLQTVLNSYATHWSRMQKDYEKLKDDAAVRPLSCAQLYSVKSDLYTLQSDKYSIQSDNYSFDSVRKTILNDMARIAEVVQRAQIALRNLESAMATNGPRDSKTTTVFLQNYSSGESRFYVDGRLACVDRSGCTLVLSGPHKLSALTSGAYQTPEATIAPGYGAIYRYLACGATGNPGQNCGLFAVLTPEDVEPTVGAARAQVQASETKLHAAASQSDKYNQDSDELLERAKGFVESLSCSQ